MTKVFASYWNVGDTSFSWNKDLDNELDVCIRSLKSDGLTRGIEHDYQASALSYVLLVRDGHLIPLNVHAKKCKVDVKTLRKVVKKFSKYLIENEVNEVKQYSIVFNINWIIERHLDWIKDLDNYGHIMAFAEYVDSILYRPSITANIHIAYATLYIGLQIENDNTDYKRVKEVYNTYINPDYELSRFVDKVILETNMGSDWKNSTFNEILYGVKI